MQIELISGVGIRLLLRSLRAKHEQFVSVFIKLIKVLFRDNRADRAFQKFQRG